MAVRTQAWEPIWLDPLTIALVAGLLVWTPANLAHAAAGNVDEALAWLNQQRRAAGAPEVTLDPRFSADAGSHARYLVRNNGAPQLEGLRAHDEDPSLPEFSSAGQQAATRSNISRGQRTVLEAVQILTYVPLHRKGMLDPRLKQIGIGFAPYGDPEKEGLAVVVDVGSGRTPEDSRPDKPIVYPVPGQRGIPVAFTGEIPDPRDVTPSKGKEVGFMISVEPSCGKLTAPKEVKLRDQHDNDVPFESINPGTEVEGNGGRRTISQFLVFAKEPLEGDTKYTVSVKGLKCGDKEHQLEWSFTTGGVRLQRNNKDEYVVRVPEQMDFLTATNFYRTYTATQRQRGLVLSIARESNLPDDAWKRLHFVNGAVGKVRVEMADGGALDSMLLRPTQSCIWPEGGEWAWDYKNGPQFNSFAREHWTELYKWGPPVGPPVVDGKDWVLQFKNGTCVRSTMGTTNASQPVLGSCPPAASPGVPRAGVSQASQLTQAATQSTQDEQQKVQQDGRQGAHEAREPEQQGTQQDRPQGAQEARESEQQSAQQDRPQGAQEAREPEQQGAQGEREREQPQGAQEEAERSSRGTGQQGAQRSPESTP